MGLTVERLGRLSALLDESLALDEAGRRRFLERLSAQDADLAPSLRSALLPDEKFRSDFEQLGTPPGFAVELQAQGAAASPGGLQPGSRVGPYELMRRLGAGGMAEVWLARRADGAFKREVALKLPMLSRLRRDLTQRFAHERDILAGLEHVNIARLYDAGVAQDGLPYLAMEFVPGEPLTAWCDAHHLELRERVRLFLQVLDAVQYAHARQVIHRDIKPSNILVTESGQVRLLDFGVAKLMDSEDGQQTELTQVYGRALTPDYASPELIIGGTVEAASDVYALGVVLYELLSGSPPYRLKAVPSIALLERAIATAQMARPSTKIGADAAAKRKATQHKLAQHLRGDLDAIVLKALAKTPSDRYGSAAAMADDLRRYLNGEPVSARRATLPYLISRFALRHRAMVAAAAAFAILVAAGIGYELTRAPGTGHWNAASAIASASNTATAAVKDKSIAVLPFEDMSEKRDQEYFSDGLSEELIDRLAHSPDLRVIARTSSFYFKGKRVTVADIGKTLGVANVLEGSVRKSGNLLRVTTQLVRASDGMHVWSQTYDRPLADVFKVQDDVADKVAHALNAVLHQRALSSTEGAGPNKEAYNLVLLGNYLLFRDQRQAEQAFSDATKLDPDYALAWAKLSRAMPKATKADRAKALQIIRHSISIDPNLSYAHTQLGWQLMFCDWNWAAAKSELDRAIELDPSDLDARILLALLTEGIFGQFDSKIRYLQQQVLEDPVDGAKLAHLVESLTNAGRYDEAINASRKLIRLEPENSDYQFAIGRALLLAGRTRDALAAMEKVSQEESRLFGLALAYWTAGRKADSDAAVAQLETKFGADNPEDMIAVRAWRGEIDAAFVWLDRDYERGGVPSNNLPLILVDPLLRNLRADQRFAVMMRKLKLDEWKKTVMPFA